MSRPTSRASAAAGVRGRPRNTTPKALTKQTAASAAERASMAPTTGTANFRSHCGSTDPARIAWKVSHSETKPLKGGSAEIATDPIRNTKAVRGILWMSPPRCSMSRSPVATSTAPEPRKSRLLNMAWLNTWSSAATSARPAKASRWFARKARASPRPITMMPMFSTV